ncbi:MAG: single-stranded DNA-binding protein [Chlamydiia bacterium]|nr:single-stranded DNA-binding protein [Chlamydiia bacterium]
MTRLQVVINNGLFPHPLAKEVLSMNYITIAGHLGADPEVRFTSSGKKVTVFRMATRSRKGQNDDTIWYRVTVWGEQYDKMIAYLKKGSAIVVFGELHRPEMFTDREGKQQISSLEVTASHIQFSPFGKGGSSGQQAGGQLGQEAGQHEMPPSFGAPSSFGTPPSFGEASQSPYSSGYGGGAKGEMHDDEVPF